MKRISIDSGKTFVSPEEALKYVVFDRVLAAMDPDTLSKAQSQPISGGIFGLLRNYLELADDDLILDGPSRQGDDCRPI